MRKKQSTRCTIRVSIVDLVVMRVRTKRAGDLPQPDFLYQAFPPDALSLIATLPRGNFPVSIPYHSNSGCGFVISRTAPTGKKGFVLVYKLKRNRRYEAVKALFQGKDYGIDEFVAYASEWTSANAGTLHRVPGKYVYLAPSREQWNVIRRDHGYMAIDPSSLGTDLSGEVLEKSGRISASGIIIRAPFLACEVKGTRLLPYFRKAELTFDTHPDAVRNWVSFREYMHMKARESDPPDSIREKMPEWLNKLKRESGFKTWVFRSGKLFGACTEWWGDRNRRFAEHEGIDFAEGKDSHGLVRPIPEGTPIRAIENGEIAAVLDDFLGKTILVRHSQLPDRNDSIFHTQYSHIVPADLSSSLVTKGQILGRVGRMTQSKVPAHFHFAAAWIPNTLPQSELTLGHLHPGYVPVTLVNFNEMIHL